MAKIKEGTVLAFSGGSYSDKWTNGPFNVLKDFDQAEIVKAFKDQFVAEDEWDEPDQYAFISYLTREGYIADVPNSFNWYIGDWDFDPVITP